MEEKFLQHLAAEWGTLGSLLTFLVGLLSLWGVPLSLVGTPQLDAGRVGICAFKSFYIMNFLLFELSHQYLARYPATVVLMA